jgi:hypothetical protein
VSGSRCQGRAAAVGSVKRTTPGREAAARMRRKLTVARPQAVALTLRLRRTARGFSLNWSKTLANLTSSSLMQAFLAGRRLARPTKPSSR